MTATIRSFEQKDQDQMRQLVLGGLKENWGKEFDPTFNPDVNDIQAYYVELQKATVVVMENEHDQGDIIGCGILLPLPAKDIYGTWCPEPEVTTGHSEEGKKLKLCRMMRLSVSPKHRGAGHAKRIVRHLIEQARAQGFDRILVETETLWTSAVGLYVSLGFHVVAAGEENTHFEYDL